MKSILAQAGTSKRPKRTREAKVETFEELLARCEREDEFIRKHNHAKVRVQCNPWRYAEIPAEIAWVQSMKNGAQRTENYLIDAPREWHVPWPTSRNAERFFGTRHAEMLKKVATPVQVVARMNELFGTEAVVCAGSDSLVLFRVILEASHVSPTFELLSGCGSNFSIPVRTRAGVVDSSRAFRGY